MDEIPIYQWNELSKDESSKDIKWDALILGNGASIALHAGFQYSSLYDHAQKENLINYATPIFSRYGTQDFEYVLYACWHAEIVNKALKSPNPRISKAYKEIRDALIIAVRGIHTDHNTIADSMRLAARFASQFETVISLNYDLTFYWAMLQFNNDNGNHFKDAFISGKFEPNWGFLRDPVNDAAGATLVFYPHGNLAIARNHLGEETKINTSNGAGGLLEAISEKWLSDDFTPVFVSEGTSDHKKAAIHRSRYLTNVYEQALPKIGKKLVVYGWSFDDRDTHILEAIAKNSPERIAVSVYTGQSKDEQQTFCHKVRGAIRASGINTRVDFFDSRSSGCWNNP